MNVEGNGLVGVSSSPFLHVDVEEETVLTHTVRVLLPISRREDGESGLVTGGRGS
jgi:hypothetical protein